MFGKIKIHIYFFYLFFVFLGCPGCPPEGAIIPAGEISQQARGTGHIQQWGIGEIIFFEWGCWSVGGLTDIWTKLLRIIEIHLTYLTYLTTELHCDYWESLIQKIPLTSICFCTGCNIWWWYLHASHSQGLGVGWLRPHLAAVCVLQYPPLYRRDIRSPNTKGQYVSEGGEWLCCSVWGWTGRVKCRLHSKIPFLGFIRTFSFILRLREHGATSLGPAALASVAVASRYPGSKVSRSKAAVRFVFGQPFGTRWSKCCWWNVWGLFRQSYIPVVLFC